MIIHDFEEEMEVFSCLFEVYVDGQVQRSTMQAPRLMIERQFITLMNKCANVSVPAQVTMTRRYNVWDQYECKNIERESIMSFANNAYQATRGNL